MKILHVLASSLGGGAVHVSDLIVHGTQEMEQGLVVSPDGGTIAHRLKDRGYEVEEMDMAKGWKWKTLALLIRYMRKYQPSVVHCHGFRAGLYGRLAAKLASPKIKTVLTVHGFHFFYCQNQLKKKLLILLEHIMQPLTHCVIAVSKTDWQHLLECGLISKEKSRVILNGIPPVSSPPGDKEETRSRLGLSTHEQPIIATVARLHYQKGVIYFLKAAPRILQFYPNAYFLIVGDGPEREELLQTAKDLNILHNLRFLGNREDVIDILRVVDVFVLASLWEGLPLSLLEAIRAEIPIVATDVDGNRDVIENGVSGLLVPPKNQEALAESVLRLLKDPSLAASVVKKAKIRWMTDFFLANMLQKTRQIYTDLMAFPFCE